jgi:nicotinate-nucleotide--dimethylbenzimidazole phosphoribosyltransferase
LAAIGIEGAPRVTLVLSAADHPVARHGVSTYATSVTREVLEATVAGQSLGAAAARAAGAGIVAVDAGVDGGPVPGTLDLRPNGRRGDLAGADALEPGDVARLLRDGRQLGADIPGQLVALGEVGVGNTTVAAALAAGLLGLTAEETVGLGAGGDMGTLDRKRRIVAMALRRFGARTGPLETIAALGGPEVVVMAGVVLGAAEGGKAIVLDGLATSVAALVAVRLEPGLAAYLVAGQRSRERAHAAVLEQLGLEPLLDLRMRAGEGAGAVLSCQLLAHGWSIRAGTARVTP